MRKLAGLAALVLIAGCSAEAPAPECDFDCTFERHMAAIQQGDFPAFEATITERPDFQLIYPGGERVEGLEAYMADMREFLALDFDFQYEIVEKQVTAEMGFALLDVTFAVEGQDTPSRFYLLLVFALQDGEWRLVHDQNTRQPPAENGDEGEAG
ncbi:YybH family protein [Parasphingopyxis marina]|uniref:Nuclear transport factor 2 family protein n=1 Tax=Parasphingopyxis marina TaxID=2761622 RepID=A0A842HU14_9SPHN|nr:nuclear transport factor 2 family protein [Parasphingopyxis marina]MBC2776425.1 nuclear transport factor 2 family protein [Parasphingopyxis marina]